MVEYAEPLCQGLAGRVLDDLVAAQVLAALEPVALELSLAAADDIQQERARLHRNWQQQLERARYQAERAQRQHDAVEPENRLVVRELERRWEEALKEQRRLEEEYARFSRNQPAGLSAGEATKSMPWRRSCRGCGKRRLRRQRIASGSSASWSRRWSPPSVGRANGST